MISNFCLNFPNGLPMWNKITCLMLCMVVYRSGLSYLNFINICRLGSVTGFGDASSRSYVLQW